MIFNIYKDNKGEWRWRLKSANGRIVADSSEGYKNKQDAQAMIAHILSLSSSTPTLET